MVIKPAGEGGGIKCLVLFPDALGDREGGGGERVRGTQGTCDLTAVAVVASMTNTVSRRRYAVECLKEYVLSLLGVCETSRRVNK